MRPGYIDITDEQLAKIQAEIERTGKNFSAALRGNSLAKKAGLYSGLMRNWEKTKRAKPEQLEIALKLWDDIPDKKDQKPTKKLPDYQRARNRHRDQILENALLSKDEKSTKPR